jgi:hypothetical protein
MGKAVEILSNFQVRNLGPGLHRDGGGLVLVVDTGGSRNWGFVYREPYTKDLTGCCCISTQWEELYAQALSSSDTEKATSLVSDASRFIDLLLTAPRTAPVTIVGTVRADFYDPLIGDEGIRALLPTRQGLAAT